MQRLQKKCFFGSLATHAVLVGVLMAGTAFMGDKTFPQLPLLTEQIRIDLVDVGDVTDGLSQQGGGGGGGSPAPAQAATPPVQPAPAQPQQPAPQPDPVAPPPAIEPPRQPVMETVVEPARPDPRPSLTPVNAKKKSPTPPPKQTAKADGKKEVPKTEVKVNLNTVTRRDDTKNRPKNTEADDRNRRAEADAKAIRDHRARQQQMAKAIGKTFEGLEQGLSTSGGGLDVASFGAGSGRGWGVGSGPTLMNYAQYVREVYDMNWIVTDAVVGDAGIVRVEIVVQRNGAARGRIVKSSGNSMLDRSVQNALDRVKTIGRSFPEGTTDTTRTFTINFNLTSKRGTG